jgi:hypothetical protein
MMTCSPITVTGTVITFEIFANSSRYSLCVHKLRSSTFTPLPERNLRAKAQRGQRGTTYIIAVSVTLYSPLCSKITRKFYYTSKTLIG